MRRSPLRFAKAEAAAAASAGEAAVKVTAAEARAVAAEARAEAAESRVKAAEVMDFEARSSGARVSVGAREFRKALAAEWKAKDATDVHAAAQGALAQGMHVLLECRVRCARGVVLCYCVRHCCVSGTSSPSSHAMCIAF